MSPCRAWLGSLWGHLEQDVDQRSPCTAQDSNGGACQGCVPCSVSRSLFQVISNICTEETCNCAVEIQKTLPRWRKGQDSRAGGALSGSYAKPTALSFSKNVRAALCPEKS